MKPHLERTYRKLRWFFESASCEGQRAITMDANSWLFKQAPVKPGRSGVQDDISDIRIVLSVLWIPKPRCGRLTPGEKQHLIAEFTGGTLAGKAHHSAMLQRALGRIYQAMDSAGLFGRGKQRRVDLRAYEAILERRKKITRVAV